MKLWLQLDNINKSLSLFLVLIEFVVGTHQINVNIEQVQLRRYYIT